MGRNDKIKYCVRSRISLKTSASLKYCIDPKTKRGFPPPPEISIKNKGHLIFGSFDFWTFFSVKNRARFIFGLRQ